MLQLNLRRWLVGILACGLLASVATPTVLGQPAAPKTVEIKPSDIDQKIAGIVRGIMEQGHISRQPFNDEISQRLHKQFLEVFDPLKLYFLQSDVDEFSRYQFDHDDATLRGDLGFAVAVYRRFLERLEQRVGWAHEFIDSPQDFSKEETIVLDRDAATYPQNDEEARERWRVRIKFETLSLIINDEKPEEATERMHRRYRTLLNTWKQMDADELVELFLTAATTSYDPHSTYMSARTLEDFQISIQLSLEGIGALLQSEDGTTVIKEIVPGGAAEKDGRLKPGDKIVGVREAEGGEMIDLVDMKLRDVVKRIRGKAGTTVRLEVIPAKSSARVVYDLVRQKIELHDREAKGEIVTSKQTKPDGSAYRVGVITLPSFYADQEFFRDIVGGNPAAGKSATSDVLRILKDFEAQGGVDGVVMDLRSNGGGLLSEAIHLTGLFIPQGPVVLVKDFGGRVTPHDDDTPVVYNGPLVVVVNKFSASASEIFAGAIQDYGRGVVVGDTSTHGKGTVQKVQDIATLVNRVPLFRGNANLGAIKLTMQQFYRVNGQSTQSRGVVSDIVLPSPTDHEDFGESKLSYALAFDQIPPARYAATNHVSPGLVQKIRDLSQKRQAEEPELIKLAQNRDLIHQRRTRKSFTFSEEILRKEREQLKDEEILAAEVEGEDGEKPSDKKFGEDPYTAEVLAITSDLIRENGTNVTRR